MPRHYRLTSDLIAAHAGGPVVAIDASASGRVYRAYSRRPGPERNRDAAAVLASITSDYVVRAEPAAPTNDVLVVEINGPIEQRAGQHEPSGSWIDGHDAICERLASAFEVGDVVLLGDSPGGAVAGGPENMRRAQEMKAKHGRRCIGHTEAGAFSACLWWMMVVCDEIYVSRDGRLGSIGARGMLASITGALAKEGVVVEIVEDPDGKAAGSPERPIDDEARARAQRDVTAAADMFRSAVCESAVGKRYGLTPETLKGFRGDVFQGDAAVKAGLADGVSTLEEVLNYALATAGGGTTMGDPEKDDEKDKAPGGKRAEDEPKKDDEHDACAKCGDDMPGESRYCAKCGTKRAEDEEPKPDAEDEEPPPSSQQRPPAHEEQGRAAARTGASVATLIGLRADASHPAIMSRLTAVMRVFDATAKLTGEKGPDAILGGLSVVGRDAANASRYRSERNAEREKGANAMRLDLAKRLIACNVAGWERGRVLVDSVGPKGERVTALSPVIAEMKPDTLRAMVEGFERTATPRSPFEPDPAKAAAEAAAAKPGAAPSGEPTEAQIAAALKLAPVVSLVKANPGLDPKTIAAQYIKTAAANAAGRTA